LDRPAQRQGFDRCPEGIKFFGFIGRKGAHMDAMTGGFHHPSFSLQNAQRVADRVLADVHLPGEILLDEALATHILPAFDRLAYAVGNLFGACGCRDHRVLTVYKPIAHAA
jgi:hypothetical protein